MKIRLGIAFLSVVLAGAARAQTSASYEMSGHVLNEGGHPDAGLALHSTSYRVSLDSVGDGLIAPVLASASYAMDAGFARSYPPPGEVHGLVALSDKITFAWIAEGSTGTYDIYGGRVGDLPDGYGTCRLTGIDEEAAVLAEAPPAGGDETLFYLVTARNRLRESGTKGYDSSGGQRSSGTPCP